MGMHAKGHWFKTVYGGERCIQCGEQIGFDPNKDSRDIIQYRLEQMGECKKKGTITCIYGCDRNDPKRRWCPSCTAKWLG